MRLIITTTILLLAACGPTLEPDAFEASESAPPRAPVEGDESSTGLGGSEGGDSSSTEHGTGGGSGGSSSGGIEPTGCSLPEADTACWAIVEAGEAVDCESVGGSCWAVVAAQYLFGDGAQAQRVTECEANCGALEAACSFVPGAVEGSACFMATEADCLANATAAGVPFDASVARACSRLAATY
jgi:hypothetical protein